MKQTIEINIPEGYKAKYNQETQKIELVKADTRSKSWEEFCKNHPVVENEWYISSAGHLFRQTSSPNDRSVNNDTTLLETKEDAEGILALIQLTRLHDEWVGDWEKPQDTDAATIFRRSDHKLTVDYLYRTSLFQFPTKEMAQEFLYYFRDLIETAIKFI